MKIFRFSYILVSYIMLASIYLINHGVAIGVTIQRKGMAGYQASNKA